MDAATEKLITVVVDAIAPRADLTADEVYLAVCGEVIQPPSREQVEQALEVLQTPGLWYTPRRCRLGRGPAVARPGIPDRPLAGQ